MALTLPPGLTPPEVAFLCEMELVTVIPRQRLEGLDLLGVSRPRHHIEFIVEQEYISGQTYVEQRWFLLVSTRLQADSEASA